MGGFLRLYVCTVHICISVHVESLTLHIGVNDMGVLHGTGVPLKSKTKDYTCIDLYTEMVWGDDNVPSTLSGRQEKAKARLVFLHYACMVKEEEKQLLANRCADAGLTGPVRVCVRVCVRSMSVRSTVVRCCADVARCCAPALVSPMLSNHAEGPKKFELGKSASRFSFTTTKTNLSRSCGLNCSFTTDSLYLPTVSISILLSFVTLHYSILTTGPTNQVSTRAEWRSLKIISITSSRPASYGHTL